MADQTKIKPVESNLDLLISSENSAKKRPAPRGTAYYPRKRANKACQVCRARRTKCDNKKPTCSFCEKVGAQCITSPTDLSSFDPASLTILGRLDELEDLLRSSDADSSSKDDNQSSVSSPRRAISQAKEAPKTIFPEYPSDPAFELVTLETVLSWFGHRFDSHMNLKVLLSEPYISSTTDWFPSPDHLVVAITGPSLESCDLYLDNFLKNVLTKNPILSEEKIREYVHQTCHNGIGWDPQSCLVLLVCALGCIASSFQSPRKHEKSSIEFLQSPNARLSKCYFAAAQRRICLVLGGGGVLAAQCFFYSGVYLMTIMKPMAAWRFFMQASACCQGFNLKKAADGPENVGVGVTEQTSQESVYWSCFKELRMELALPGFGFEDLWYPSFFPSLPSADLNKEEERAWYYYFAEIALRKLVHSLFNYLSAHRINNGVWHVSEMTEPAAAFEKQAADWVASLPAVLSLQTPENEDDVLKFILRGHLLNCYEFIYWPFISEAINHGCRGPAIDEYTVKGLQMCVSRIFKNRRGFMHRHHGTWLMIRTCTRSAFVLVAAYSRPNIKDLVPEDWKDAVASVLGILNFWQDEIPDVKDRFEILTKLMAESAF